MADKNLIRRELTERYGGIKAGPSFFGWLSALGVSAILIAFLSGIGAVTFDGQPVNQSTASIAGIFMLVALAVAYYAGGYVAGRMARFSGARQGIGVWLIGILAGVITTVLGVVFGVNFGLLRAINSPSLAIDGSTALTALIALLVAATVALVAAMAGGKVGEGYHHKIDSDTERLQEYETKKPTESMSGRYSPSFGETIDNRETKNKDKEFRR